MVRTRKAKIICSFCFSIYGCIKKEEELYRIIILTNVIIWYPGVVSEFDRFMLFQTENWIGINVGRKNMNFHSWPNFHPRKKLKSSTCVCERMRCFLVRVWHEEKFVCLCVKSGFQNETRNRSLCEIEYIHIRQENVQAQIHKVRDRTRALLTRSLWHDDAMCALFSQVNPNSRYSLSARAFHESICARTAPWLGLLLLLLGTLVR